MRKVVAYLLFGGLVFAASAGASWFFSGARQADARQEEQATGSAAVPEPVADGKEPAQKTPSSELPVPIHSRPMTPEEMFRYSMTIRKRETALKEREQLLKDQTKRLQLVQEDIRGERGELESLLEDIRKALVSAEDLLNRLQQERQKLQQEKEQTQSELEQFEQAQGAMNDQESENVKLMAEWFGNMQPEQAADYLKQLSNDGKMDLAAQLLSHLEARDAAKILGALSDPGLVVQLTELFKGLTRPDKKKNAADR